ncbi:MAG: hypothetical protein KTM48_02670, partial [Wolbachia endosymbiont of Pissodes strobi]|nr:hypothetical protein [Wolbachia endosymbiont of Pissodes strobi]
MVVEKTGFKETSTEETDQNPFKRRDSLPRTPPKALKLGVTKSPPWCNQRQFEEANTPNKMVTV